MPVSKKRKKQASKQNKKKQSEPKWKSFEKIVAAIHLAETQGATVTWDEKIEGRQFDVVIRFKIGLYNYLTLIECKDYSIPVPIGKVEAFVTKAKHHKASKAIMVSPHGFQSGAEEVARRENIELYSLKQINRMPENLITDFLLTTVIIQPLAFYKDEKEVFTFSRLENEVYYQIENIKFSNYGKLSLGSLINPLKQLLFPFPIPGVPDIEKSGFPEKRATPKQAYSGFKMMDNTVMEEPKNGKKIEVDFLRYRYWSRTGYLVNTGGIDPTVYKSFGEQYEYRNELTNEVNFIDPNNLSLGINTVMETGKYYTQPQFKDFIYYCKSVEKEFFTIFLINSYQHGKLFRMESKQPLTTVKDYVEITDEAEIKKARKLYKDFIDYKANNLPTTLNDDTSIWIS